MKYPIIYTILVGCYSKMSKSKYIGGNPEIWMPIED